MTELSARLARVTDILEGLYGRPSWKAKEPLDELMLTILSQSTNDRNRDLAYARLRAALPAWEQVANVEVSYIEELIRPAGLSRQKSVRMKAVLEWIGEEFGSLSVSRLGSLSDDEAITLLTSQVGIGVKTAAVVMAFAFGRDLCPVDTHVHRIAQRLGWVQTGLSAERTFYHLRPAMPVGRSASFHLNLLRFGRATCTARNANCTECPFRAECPSVALQ